LLISRIRDESPHGLRVGVIRTVGSTGGVITAAGLIFAASMFGLLFASISMMVQAGFVLGMGILLDTFLVRTVTVPAIATLVGDANWWPSRPQEKKHRGGKSRNRLTQIRTALTPKFVTKRRLATPPSNVTPVLAPDEIANLDDVEPALPASEAPVGTGGPQQTAGQFAVLAATPSWPAGNGLDR
jgi:putative drug exporter of the RND superfamily